MVDVVVALTESADAKDYWYHLKLRERESSGVELSTFCRQLKLLSADGKRYSTDCANTKNMFRIIQSIPSPKAEPFKQWLAQVGYERVQEIENPELLRERMHQIYLQKGYSEAWIKKRLDGIETRQKLTEEWHARDVKEGAEFAILTNEISKATFGKTIEEHKKLKSLSSQNLRDHMTRLELIFAELGEASTTEIARSKDARGFEENKVAAKKGGKIAGDAKKNLELETGEGVVTPENYLDTPEKVKKLRKK